MTIVLVAVILAPALIGYSGAVESERSAYEEGEARGNAQGKRTGKRQGRAKGRRDGQSSASTAGEADQTASDTPSPETGTNPEPETEPETETETETANCPDGQIPAGETGACAPAEGTEPSGTEEDYEYEKDVYEQEGCSAETPERCRG